VSAVPVAAAGGGAAVADGALPLSTGLNADGQLGNGSTTNRVTAGATSLGTNIVQIASGREHAYALDDAGRVWAWGDNSRGAVGDGTNTDRPTPVLLGLTNVAEVEAGHYHGIARRTDGTVWTWGYGSLGQLGLGTTNNRTSPAQVPGIGDAVAVAAGRDMSYVVRADGTMLAFGLNSFGELGDGTTTRRLSPVAVQDLTGVAEVSGGRNHALVRRDDGSVWAFGAGDYGQLGTGSIGNRLLPVQVLAGPVIHVDAGAEHSLAVMADGTVRSWGRGYRGQLGLGTTTTRTSPTAVPGLTGIVEVGDGRDQSFAMNATGDIWAWGYNDTGQLADGTTAQRNSPVRLTGLTGIVAAQGGRGMTIFLPRPVVTEPDVTPPSAPGQPAATSTVAGRVDLAWAASTDDRATMVTYTVFRDLGADPIGAVVGGVTGTITFADVGRTPGAVHTYTVRASDGTNTSDASVASAPVTVSDEPDATTHLATGFDGGLAGWTVRGAMTADAALGSPTAPSLRAAVSSAFADARRSWPGSPSSVCATVDVRVTSITGTARYSLLKLRNSGGASVARVEVNRNRQLFVRADVPGTRFTVGAQLPFGSWQEVTLCATNGATDTIRLLIGGVQLGSWTVDVGTQPITQIQIGDDARRTATVNWDDVLVTSGD
jgi:alpha-tubulin suppressor-like RCC1 family protein